MSVGRVKPVNYEYLVLLKNPGYVMSLIEARIGVRVIGIARAHTDRPIIQLERELTDDEKAILDSIIAENPEPASIYELSPLTPEDVEAEVGIKPVIVQVDPAMGTARVCFDTTLAPEQEALLEALLRAPMKFKRRKP